MHALGRRHQVATPPASLAGNGSDLASGGTGARKQLGIEPRRSAAPQLETQAGKISGTLIGRARVAAGSRCADTWRPQHLRLPRLARVHGASEGARLSKCPGRSAARAKRSGALQTRDRYGPWRSRISGAPLHFVTRCTASGTRDCPACVIISRCQTALLNAASRVAAPQVLVSALSAVGSQGDAASSMNCASISGCVGAMSVRMIVPSLRMKNSIGSQTPPFQVMVTRSR